MIKKSKQLILLLLYLHTINDPSMHHSALRYTDISNLLKMPDSTVRGVLSSFSSEGVTDKSMLTPWGRSKVKQLFPILVTLETVSVPYTLHVVKRNLSRAAQRSLRLQGAVAYRAGVWVTPATVSFPVPSTSIRLDKKEEEQLMESFRSFVLYKQMVRQRKNLRSLLLKKKSNNAVIGEIYKVLQLSPIIPEYNFSKELRLNVLIESVLRAVFG